MIYKAEWKSEKLSLEFQQGKSCEIEIDYTIGEKELSKKWQADANLKEKTENNLSFYGSM